MAESIDWIRYWHYHILFYELLFISRIGYTKDYGLLGVIGLNYIDTDILEMTQIKNRTVMAKAILEYDLNDFDDAMAHRRAIKSTDMAIVLHELQNLHKRVEHELDGITEFQTSPDDAKELSPYAVIDLYREKIHDLFQDNGINLDELIR